MENIRNFSIIAHIDAGKSTLADRLLEITDTVSPRLMQKQFLDDNPIERQRGITIKLAPVTMKYHSPKQNRDYSLNLIDTPGHIDFNYEVERSLQACEGAILLVDATKGVQAQTVTNLHLAQKLGLKVIPVINKIDAQLADVDAAVKQTQQLLNTSKTPHFISAKTGQGVNELLEIITFQIPPPSQKGDNQPLTGLIFNSIYHSHLGVIAFIRLVSGVIKDGDKLFFKVAQKEFVPQEIGIFAPQRQSQPQLAAGSVGYIITGFKDIHQVRVGDTVVSAKNKETPGLPGFRTISPNVFFDIFPQDSARYLELADALAKLKLNDAALQVHPVNSSLLGQGIKVGFLGLLHSEVIIQRLNQEFDLQVIVTSPSVEYKVRLKDGQNLSLSSPVDFPDSSLIDSTQEPIAKVNIITPPDYTGPIMQVCQNLRGQLDNMNYLDQLVKLEYTIPLVEVITSLHDSLKSVSSGFASLDYSSSGFQDAKLVKLDVLLNHQEVPPLSLITIQEQAQTKAHRLSLRLKEVIPRQQFEVPIQVALGGKILARETIKAFRKDVTAKLYGGDATRRKKLLSKQKKGKKKMQQLGRVNLPQEAFLAAVKLSD